MKFICPSRPLQLLLGSLLLAGAGSALADASHHQHGASADSAAIGQPGSAAQVSRTVKVDMTDNMRFTPASIKVRQGETIRFVISNSGKIRHEMVFGSDADLKAHYAAMLKNPEMEHADDNQLTLAAGRTGDLIWTFSNAGLVNFACLQPGHYDAGMKGSVTVAAGKTSSHQH
ncbi:cupredoxin domain-containing protein [Herbaspirillum autotrophicum]|uniref:cupredoxin domain-containing protein n=1 Tax=Herbaspirillum autotrophicum TaxID=180195 RepID=UPI00067B3825|nr:cupredoxin family protein [Herbaspirillum autotrophicum]